MRSTNYRFLNSDCGTYTLPNGLAKYPSGSKYGSYAVHSCDEGFKLNGSHVAYCESDETWTEKPTCVMLGSYSKYALCIWFDIILIAP